jgi:hypothetical protein
MTFQTKVNFYLTIGTLALVFLFSIPLIVWGGDKQIDATIESLEFKLDRNESPYARAIIQDEFELNGVKYTKGVPVMAFGEGNKLEDYNKGDRLKAIVGVSEYNGRTSYNLIKILE